LEEDLTKYHAGLVCTDLSATKSRFRLLTDAWDGNSVGSRGGAPSKATALRIFAGLWSSYDAVLEYGTLLQDRRWKDWVIGSLSGRNDATVLDVGCGTCVLEGMMSGGVSVIGVDLTEGMIRAGQGKRIPRVTSLLRSDGERLPFKACSFDAVVSCYVVKYCSGDLLVSEMARVLKPGGRLVVYDFARPRGRLWPFNAFYVYGALRTLGELLELIGLSVSTTFTELPGIIAGSSWDEGFWHTLVRAGLTPRVERVLSGGVAVGFVADK
jgi:demethylmenaquinone methyltransferase/2-methoxy-6-polyprenyl-1,4-benzoquinol methylase